MPKRDWNPADSVTEYRLGDEERRLFGKLVKAVEKLAGVEETEEKIKELSTQSDKLEKDAKVLDAKVNTQQVRNPQGDKEHGR